MLGRDVAGVVRIPASQPLVEEVITIDPLPRSIMCGATALADFQTPVRLTPIIWSHWSSVSSQNGAWVQMPALAMRMSIFPNSAMPRETASSSCRWLRTSALTARARLSYASTSLTVSSRSSWVGLSFRQAFPWVVDHLSSGEGLAGL